MSNQKIERGFNDLASCFPEIAKEWDSELNGEITPQDVFPGTSKKYHWIYPYDDPNTGKHWEFRWIASVASRTKLGRGCPQLSNQKVEVGFNDLKTLYPEIAKEWHPSKNGNLTPRDVTPGYGKKVWWYLPYDDPNTGRHWDFEWEARVADRCSKGNGCPQLAGKIVEKGFNDLATTNPKTAELWDYKRNAGVTPFDITAGSHNKYYWIYPYDDPKTGKHWDFKNYAKVCDAIKWTSCPQLEGKIIEKGFNDLASLYPEIAAQWDYEANGKETPFTVTAFSNKPYHWIYPYDDPRTGKHWDFKWKSRVSNRVNYPTCPFIINQLLCKGFNDFETLYPELAKEWHPTANGNLKPSEICGTPHREVWWLYSYVNPLNGKRHDYSWKATISNRVKGTGCPYLPSYESHGETSVVRFLNDRHLRFERQKKFDGLVGVKGRKLSYDFAIHCQNSYILIEYQGIQHYEPVDFEGKGEKHAQKQFEIQKEHDKRKKRFAKENGYKLKEIKYTFATDEEISDYLSSQLMGLYIFTFYIPDEKETERLKSIGRGCFQLIIVNCYDKIYTIQENCFLTVDVSDKLKWFKSEALRLSLKTD